MKIVMPTIAELQQQLITAREQIDLIKMVTDELVTELDIDKLLTSVAEKAREVIQAETLVVPMIDDAAKLYTYKAAAGKNAESILNQSFPVSMGMCGWVLSHKKPLVFARDLPWLMDQKTSWEEGMESALLVPLMARGEIIGGLSGLGKKGGGSFTREDQDLLVIFANQISIAIDNAKVFKALKRQKELTEITLNSIGDAVIATDAQGRVMQVNPVASSLLACPKDELIGKPLKDVFKIYNSETREPVNDPVDKVMATGDVVGLANHTVLVAKNGHEYQIADSAAPIRDDNGEMLGVVLVFRDVTEEYHLHANLRRSEERHRRLVEHLGDEYFMFVKQTDGDLSYVSPSVFECLGYTPQEMIDNFHQCLTDNNMHHIFEEKLKLALVGVPPEPYEIEIKNKQGQLCWLRISETPILDDARNVIAIDGVVHNITQQREMELSLRQSQKMQAVGQLSGGIAHDFNNQLGVVTGYLEMLQENTPVESSEARWIATAIEASQRCVDLTRDLLSFSHKRKISLNLIDLNDSLLLMQNMIKHSITEAIELEYKLTQQSCMVMIDEGELQNVILNLVINARDAMPAGGALTICTELMTLSQPRQCYLNELSAGSYVKLSIKDTGTGMSEDVIEHIFEPFFTTKTVGSGTGLGMPLVYAFVSHVGGAIDVHSVEGEGTRYDLYIPRSRPKKNIEIEPQYNQKLPEGNETVLLVEDEPALRSLATEYLELLGYRVFAAENAYVAIEKLKHNQDIDLLFSDVVMPGGIDGYELAVIAKQMYPSIKVLLATGYASQANAGSSGAADAEAILYKPYSQSILAQRVRRVLEDENIISR